jgi:hypothetical protein
MGKLERDRCCRAGDRKGKLVDGDGKRTLRWEYEVKRYGRL